MPVIKSAQKQMRQTREKTVRNRQVKDAFKAKIKDVKKSIGVVDTKKLQVKLSEAYSEIDKAAKRNVIHKNSAARKKSRLSKLVKEGKKVKAEKKTAAKKKNSTKK